MTDTDNTPLTAAARQVVAEDILSTMSQTQAMPAVDYYLVEIVGVDATRVADARGVDRGSVMANIRRVRGDLA